MNFSLRPPSLNDLPPATRGLVMVSFCGWILEMAFRGPLNYYFGLVPLKVAGSGWLWQPITYIFIHGGFWHFLFNAFMLWMMGSIIEPVMGSRKFFVYFLFCGAAAGLITVVVSPGSAVAVIGASGAIYGLLYAFAALYPDQTVYMYFLFPMSARQLVMFLAGLSLVLSFTTPNSSVANFTHLSGLAAGWLYFQTIRWVESSAAARQRDSAAGGEGDSAAGTVQRFWGRVFGGSSREAGECELETSRKVDAILEKISRKGEAALTAGERRALDEYARNKGGRA
ncbi:MAG: rhomboid family intramembrane serine protease [Elusimicrobiota bacterium]